MSDNPGLDYIKWTAVSQIVRGVLAFSQITLLSRVLSPNDFGVMALAMTSINITMVFADLGVSSAIIHYQNVTKTQLSTLYWINLLFSVVLYAAILFLSTTIAAFYREPRLASVLALVGLFFPISAIGQQLRVVAEKSFRFKRLAAIEISASVLSLAVGVAAAVSGAGVYALALAFLAGAVVHSISAWLWLAEGWLPSLVFSLKEARHLLSFGVRLIVVNVANNVGAQADILVLGRYASAHTVGLYFQPKELVSRITTIVNPIATRVATPMIAATQTSRSTMSDIYIATLLSTLTVTFPCFAVIGYLAPELCAIVLGKDWIDSAEFMRWIAVLWALRSIGSPVGSLLVGAGRATRYMYSSIAVASLVVCVSILTCLFLAPERVPATVALLYGALVVPFWAFLVHPACGLGLPRYLQALGRPAICTALALLAGHMAALVFPNGLLKIASVLMAGAVAYILSSAVFNRAILTQAFRMIAQEKGLVDGRSG